MKTNYFLSAIAALFTIISYGQIDQFAPAEAETIISSQPVINSSRVVQRPATIGQSIQNSNPTGSFISPSGQHFCASHELNEQHYTERGILEEFNQSYHQSASNAANLNFPKTPGVNEISVIFHVVHNPLNPAENVSNAQIMALFQELQEDYLLLNADAGNVRPGFGFTPADVNVNFCLATQDPFGAPLAEVGVVRVSTSEDYYDHDGGEENKMKAALTGGSEIWDRNKYMNVWICNITNGLNYGTAGYAYRPTPTVLPGSDRDGIVIDYNIGFGSNVLTHEVGHYLGLDHTWGGSGGCGNDDSFTDTPQTIGPADQDPSFSCGMPNYVSCTAEVQYENYMDYATGCTVMFTQEQANYMLSILQGIRGSLLLSPGCDPTNTPPNSAFASVPAGPSPVIIPQNASVSFFDQSTNVPTGWTWTISGTQGVDWAWINTTNQNSQDPVAEFYNTGLYDVTLTASNSYGVDATPAIELGYVQVVGAATGIGCDTLRNYDPAATAWTTSWNAPSVGYLAGNTYFAGPAVTVTEYAEYYAGPTTDVRALEFIAVRVNDNGGDVIFKVWADNGGVPDVTPLTTETVPLADLTELAWNNIEFTTPATGLTTFWVGYEFSYNGTDTFALAVDNTVPAMELFANIPGFGWTNAYSGNDYAAFMDVLTSTGPPPSMNFSASGDTLCVGGDILVDGSMSTNNIDYRWYVTDDPWVTTLETSGSSSNTFNFPYAPGLYNVYLFGSGSCLNDGVYMPVELFPSVSATVTPSATTCGVNNGSITVTAPSGGDGTYYYSLDGVNYQAGNTFTGLAPGDYDVFVATLGDNCYMMQTVTVNASSPPVANASAAAAICPGGSTTVTATGGGTYQWFDGVNPIGTGNSIAVSPSSTTQYDCIVTVGGCVTNAQATVTVNPLPPAPTITTSGSTTICSGSSVDLTSSYGTNNLWSTTETGSSITVSTAGPVTVSYTDPNGCINTSIATVIVVNTPPTISAGTIVEPSSCGTSTGTIEVSGSGTGDVSWAGTATGTTVGVTLPYTITGLAAGSYNITITDGNGCTSNILAQGLNDPNPPTTPTITAGGPITFCDGGSVVLTSSYGSNNSWSTAETTSSITVTTSQTISVTYVDGFGCSSTSLPTVITVNPNPAVPTITAGGPLTFCEGGSVDLTSSQGTGNNWSTAESTQTISATSSGAYTVTFTNGNGCSATSVPTNVVVNPLPVISFGPLSDICDYNSPTTLSGATPAGGTYSGTGVTGVMFDPGAAGIGTHTITYTYTDGNGCTNFGTQDIIVDACLGIEEQFEMGLNIFPNPTTHELNISLEGDFKYEVVDARGRIIADGFGNKNVKLTTTYYESGVYFVTVSNAENTSVTRVVKQ